MALKITLGNIVAFKVKGDYNDAAGKPVPFEFTLTAKRLTAAQIDDTVERLRTEDGYDFLQFLQGVATDWSGVTDDAGTALPFTADNLTALFTNIPGLATMTWRAYCDQVGAKAKN